MCVYKGNKGFIWLKNKETVRDIPESETPDYMNGFFTNIGPKLGNMHRSTWEYYGQRMEGAMPDFQTDVEEVIDLCKEIETLKSSGLDEISAKLCKDAFMALPEHMTHIFNCSLDSGIFPDKWKAAKIVPIFKGRDREVVGNYRPVSLLPLPGKLLEKIVHTRISQFLEGNDFLTEHQGGFRKGFRKGYLYYSRLD